VHLTTGNMLQTMEFEGVDWFEEMQCTLTLVARAIRTYVSPKIKYSPAHLAFNQDKIYHKAVTIDWQSMNDTMSVITLQHYPS
jgi:hypothetical protein